jgi:hypothetical protein
LKHSKHISVATKLSLLLVLVVFLFVPVGEVVAQGGVIDSVPVSTVGTATWPFGSSVWSIGQGFTGNDYYVTEAQVVLYRSSSGVSVGDVWIVAEIYASNGAVFGSDLPTGSALATSVPLLLNADISTVVAGVSTFTFDGSFQALSGVHYFLVVRVIGGNLDGGDLYVRGVSTGLNGGAFVALGSSSWSALSSTVDWMFTLFGVPTVVTPSPSPSVPVDGFDSDLLLFVLFFVLALVVFVLALARGSVGFYALSGGLWILFGFVLQVFGVGQGLWVGFSYVSFLLGLIMVLLMFGELYRMFDSNRGRDGEGVF